MIGRPYASMQKCPVCKTLSNIIKEVAFQIKLRRSVNIQLILHVNMHINIFALIIPLNYPESLHVKIGGDKL